MQKIVIGFAGEMAAGKGVGTTLVKQWYPNTPSFRFSDGLREFYTHLRNHVDIKKDILTTGNTYVLFSVAGMLVRAFGQLFGVIDHRHVGLREFIDWLAIDFIPKRRGVWTETASTPDLQDISTALRQCFGADILDRAIASRIKASASESPIIIVDGIRRFSDISSLMKNPDILFGLIYIEADALTRYIRHKSRSEKPGDASLTLEEFYKLGHVEAEREIVQLRSRSQAIIDNSGNPTHLKCALRMLIDAWIRRRSTR